MRRPLDPRSEDARAGYTIAEVAVAAVVAGLVVATAAAAYLVGARALGRLERDVSLDADVRVAYGALARDLRAAEAAALAGPDSLVLTTGGAPGRTVSWAVRDSALYRDTVRVHGADVRTVEYAVEGAGGDDSPRAASVSVRFALTDGRRTERRAVVHAWRTPAGWPRPAVVP